MRAAAEAALLTAIKRKRLLSEARFVVPAAAASSPSPSLGRREIVIANQ